MGIVDYLFSRNCIYCRKSGNYICSECESRLFKPSKNFICPFCKQFINKSRLLVHTDCASKTYLDGIYTCYEYNEAAKFLLKKYKYDLAYKLSEDIVQMIEGQLTNLGFPHDKLTYVPLHKSKEQKRGFNQVKLVLNLIYKNRNIDYLIRTKSTKTQANLNQVDRAVNMDDSFALSSKVRLEDITGRHFVVMDDVFTTGATLESCAQILKQHGAKAVYGFTWFRS